MQWRKDADMKYVDMAIFIDAHVKEIQEPGVNPELENKIYNYLWLIVKALAIKKCMFQDFKDYDPYAFYAANRLFFALRKNLTNQGKVVKGKLIRPIKSCLNYMKALLYPMKIEYQRESFQEVISEEYTSKQFDAFAMREKMKAEVSVNQGVNDMFWEYLQSSLKHVGALVDKIMKDSPFTSGTQEYQRIKISILYNCLVTLKTRKRLDAIPQTLVMWRLPKSLSSYVRLLLHKLFTELKLEIIECYREVELDDTVLDKLIANPGDEDKRGEYEE